MWTRRLVLTVPAGAFAASAEPLKIDLFTAGDAGYAVYRIPGLVVTGRGTVLVYCEARRSAGGDWGEIDLLLRRGIHGGRSFAPPSTIPKPSVPIAENPVAVAQNLAREGVTFNNLTAIADLSNRSRVHAVFCAEYMRMFYTRTEDDGISFTAPVEITAVLEPLSKVYDWKVCASGPGHGIQLRNGRLLIPIWLSTGSGGHAHRPSVVTTIYSDDGGRNWSTGEVAVQNTAETVNPNETAAVELADGRIMLNSRSESSAHRRLLTFSPDGATRWSKPQFHPELLEPICMGSMVRLKGRPERLVFSNPDNLTRSDGKERPGSGRDRRNLTIKVSEDQGKTWPVSRVLEPGPSGYSDLAALKDGTVLVFYERGKNLTLARLDPKWLLR